MSQPSPSGSSHSLLVSVEGGGITITEPDEESLEEAEGGGITITEPEEDSLEEVSLEEVTAVEDSLEEVSLDEETGSEESFEEAALEGVCDAVLEPVAPSLISVSGTDTSGMDVFPDKSSIVGRLPFVSSVVIPFEDSSVVASVETITVLDVSVTSSVLPKMLHAAKTIIATSATNKTNKITFFIRFLLIGN